MKVLVAGFSVVSGSVYRELDGYNCRGINFNVAALGAHHYHHLYLLIDTLMGSKGYDLVLLDLLSTPCRSWVNVEHFRKMLDAFTNRIRRNGSEAGFLNLWRHDIVYETDGMLRMVEDAAQASGLQIVELLSDFNAMSVERRKEILWDGVHATPTGALMLRNMIAGRTKHCTKCNLQFRDNLIVERQAVDPKLHATGYSSTSEHSRYGINVPTVSVVEGETLNLSFNSGQEATGAFFVTGPEAGLIEVSGQEWSRTIDLIDGHSYYERLKFIDFPKGQAGDSLSIRPLPGLSPVRLAKGQFSDGPRSCTVSLVSVN